MTENPRQNVTFPSGGGEAHGYLALPPSGQGPGIVLIQEWWGLDDHMADVADRLAAEGFVVLAPDLFGGRVTHDSEEASQMLMELPVEKAVQELGNGGDMRAALTQWQSQSVAYAKQQGFTVK